MSTKGKELEATIRFKGAIDSSLLKSASKAKAAVNLNLKSINSTFKQMDAGYSKIVSGVGRTVSTVAKATAAATAAAAGAVALVTKKVVSTGNEFESAFAGVKKTVDGTVEDFDRLRNGIISMSKEIPSGADEIAHVMEVAGQLGIPLDQLESFTETMIKLGVTTNISADEAATSLAKFANITGMSTSDYEKLGATIVDLGNNFATTEADIVAMATNLASTGELTGLTEAEILALSTAMSSVGIAAERGGSTMSKVLKNITTQVETDGKKLGQYASVAGMTESDFKKTFANDPTKALAAFIDGLDDVERNGKSAVVILNEMGLTEVRLSNTLLALANGSDVLTGALETANTAWKEGSALTEEAEKRYETLESKTGILSNNIDALAIGAYDQIRGPLGEAVEWLTGEVQDFAEYALGPQGIRKWIKDIKEGTPKFIKKVKDVGGAVLDFASPVIDLGKWLIKHPKFLATAFIQLGSALVAYKIASTTTKVVNGIATLCSNPVMLGITGVAVAFGAIGGAVAASKMRLEELKQLDLEKRFGDISLSLEDIEDAANHLLNGDGSITKLNEAFKALSDVDEVTAALKESIDTINKGNWKVSIGMSLTGEDAEEYKQAIEQYIKDCNKYVIDNRYAVTLAVSLFTDNTDISNGVNKFYNKSLTQMDKLGRDLATLVNQAFADDVLDSDDDKIMEKIIAKQNKMAELQSKLAAGQMDAQLSLLRSEYGGTALTADSFKTLQEKLAEIESSAKETYSTEYVTAMAALNSMQKEGIPIKGGYEAAAKEIEQGYTGKIAELTAKSVEFSTSVLLDKYGKELEKVGHEWFSGSNAIRENDFLAYGAVPWANIESALVNSLPKEVRSNVEELIENLTSSEELQTIKDSLIAAGFDVTSESVERISKAISDVNTLEALSGETDAMWKYLIEQFTNNPMYQDFLKRMQEMGGFIPESIIDGVNSGVLKSNNSGWWSRASEKLHSLTGHANGGIFSSPHIASLCEKGPESIIPLDGTANALSLWRKTGQLLGMGSLFEGLDLNGRGANVTYSPTLVFNGNSPSQNDIEAAMRTSQDEFDAMMDRYLKNRARVAF